MTQPAPTHAAAVRALKAAFAAVADSAATQAFVEQVGRDLAPDELPELSAEALADALVAFWAFGAQRKGTGPAIRLTPMEPGLDRLEIVQADAPFLVDSVMGEIAEQGLSVRAMFHPVVEVARDRKGVRADAGTPRRESMILVMLERVGADREAALIEGVRAALGDVRAAVDDFPDMLALMGRTITEVKALALTGKEAARRDEDAAFLAWLKDEHFV